MPNIKLVIEYHGAGFHGWQEQPNLRSIQVELRRVVEMVLRRPVGPLMASGRTDSGVHARRQVVNFFVDEAPAFPAFIRSVSGVMRGEVAVLEACVVPDNFSARGSAKSKQYSYTILNRPAPAALDRGLVWHIPRPLDIERLSREAAVLRGVHDFASFQGAGADAGPTVRELFVSEIVHEAPYVIYRVEGSGFLKQMVRNIVGTLVGLSRGNLKLKSIEEILERKDRRVAGVTAPAYGLCLDWVKY